MTSIVDRCRGYLAPAVPFLLPQFQRGRRRTRSAASNQLCIPVPTLDMLDHLFARSHQEPILLFLHAQRCLVSRRAYRQVVRVEGDIWLIDVERSQELSHEIERRTGVRHESPQAIVLSGGRARWSASHRHVTTAAVRQALIGAQR